MKIDLLGVAVDNLTFSESLDLATGLMEHGNRQFIVTPNPEFLVYAHQNPQFREILNRAHLAIPDGVGLLWASRSLGRPLQERVAGADLAESLVSRAAEKGLPVFLLGGRGKVAEEAARRLKERYRGLNIVGTLAGEPSPDWDDKIKEAIGASKVALLLVAYGHPRQELWIDRNLKDLDVNLAMGVGGAFDFWSGRVKRAPMWARRAGLEWLIRLVKEPWRIRRQLALPAFVWLIVREHFAKQ